MTPFSSKLPKKLLPISYSILRTRHSQIYSDPRQPTNEQDQLQRVERETWYKSLGKQSIEQ